MPRMSNPQARAAVGGGPRQAHGGQSACQPSRGMEAWEEVGSLDVLASGGRAQEAGTGLDGRALGPERPGLAWLRGSSAGAQEVGVERPARGGDRERWSPGGLCRNREEEQAWLADDVGAEGRPGKHVRAAGPEPGPPPSPQA